VTGSYYSEAFHPVLGRCFGFVGAPGVSEQPTYCPQPPVWRRTFVAADGAATRLMPAPRTADVGVALAEDRSWRP
jgi:hypothetical protein